MNSNTVLLHCRDALLYTKQGKLHCFRLCMESYTALHYTGRARLLHREVTLLYTKLAYLHCFMLYIFILHGKSYTDSYYIWRGSLLNTSQEQLHYFIIHRKVTLPKKDALLNTTGGQLHCTVLLMFTTQGELYCFLLHRESSINLY